MNNQEAIQFLKEIHEDRLYDGKLNYVEHKKMFEVIEILSSLIAKPTPDPDTGLVPCGCGGKAKIWLSDLTRLPHLITDYDVGCTDLITDYEVGCTECAMTTGWVRGRQENAVKAWNTAMGYTAPPLSDAGREVEG